MAKSKNSKPTHFLDNSKEFQFLNINSQIPVYDHSNVTAIISKVFMDNKPRVNYCTLRDQQTVHEKYISPDFEVDSNTIFNEKKEHWENTSKTLAKGYSSSREVDDVLSSFVVFLAGLMIRAMSFQMNVFISFFTFPVWLMYYSFMFVFDPFRILKWVQNRTLGVFFVGWYCFCDSVSLPLKGQKSVLKLVVRFCWGFFWSAYVCFLLFGLLVLGFVIGGVTMCYLVEEPIHITENLNFDYSKSNPVALVPIMSCPSVSCGLNCKENIELEKYVGSRVIAPNQNLNLAISLKLPESDYNQKLGVFQWGQIRKFVLRKEFDNCQSLFNRHVAGSRLELLEQVKVDLLLTDGEVTASPSYPCMLQFKSQLIRYIETFLRSFPLLAGYSSESQIISVKMKGFTEGNEPTSCLKVILEQRAEYRAGSGIPEIYAASLVLESELPLVKKILWYWRKTIFVWISMASFMMELMFILVCCRPVIIPRSRAIYSPGKRICCQNDIALIKNS